MEKANPIDSAQTPHDREWMGHQSSPQGTTGYSGKMRAAVLCGPKALRIEWTAIPKPGAEEVLVRLEGCGVCSSNLPVWEGRSWFEYPLEPGAPGHEAWGVIEAAGEHVKRPTVGTRVAFLSYHGFSEYDLAEASQTVDLPAQLNHLPVPGEPLGCAMNILRRCAIEPGQTVAVIGIGFIGALLVSLANRAGARVIAISRRPCALAMARRLGAQATIPMEDHRTIVETVKALTGAAGCDRAIEAVGEQWPLDLAGDLVRERGRLIIAGYHQDGPRRVNMQAWNWKGIDVINAHERDPRQYVQGIHDAVQALIDGQLDPTPLYSHSFSLHELSRAFELMQERPEGFFKAWVRL